MKKRLLISIALLIISVSTMTTAIAAWFTPSAQYIDNIIVTTGSVDAEAVLLEIQDFNRDGILDVVGGENVFVPITEISIENMIPQNVYSYRLDVKNTGEALGNLSVYFADIEEGLSDVLTYESVVKDNQGNIIEGAGVSKQIFSQNNEFCYLESMEPLAEDFQVSIYFKITFESLENLKILNPLLFEEKEDLNEYQNLNFGIGKVIVYLEQAIEELT